MKVYFIVAAPLSLSFSIPKKNKNFGSILTRSFEPNPNFISETELNFRTLFQFGFRYHNCQPEPKFPVWTWSTWLPTPN